MQRDTMGRLLTCMADNPTERRGYESIAGWFRLAAADFGAFKIDFDAVDDFFTAFDGSGF